MPDRAKQWHSTLADLWTTQSQWSRAADAHKAAQRSWNGPLIVVGFVGVVFSTISPYAIAEMTSSSDNDSILQFVLTIIGPLLVTLAAILTREVLGPKEEQKWIHAREVAEGLKAEGYIYAADAPPYADPTTAPTLLATKIDELVGDLVEPLPPPKKEDRTKPHDPISVDDYIAQRADGQRTFHEDDARKFADSLATWRWAAIVLMTVSGALGVIAGVAKAASLNVWIAVVSTALATVVAYVHVSRLEFMAATYAATARRLQGHVRAWKAKVAPSPAERDRFILDCEAVLAAQNRAWSDELSKRVIERLKVNAPPP